MLVLQLQFLYLFGEILYDQQCLQTLDLSETVDFSITGFLQDGCLLGTNVPVFRESDKDKNRMISFQEFLEETERDEFEKVRDTVCFRDIVGFRDIVSLGISSAWGYCQL